MVKIRTSPAGRRRPDTAFSFEQGFTLLELLVVMAIIGLALALLPGFALRASPALDLERAASRIADGLRKTQSQAVLLNREQLFVIDVDSRQFRAGAQAVPVQIDRAIALNLVTARSERSGETQGRIRFFPDGSSTGGQVVLNAGGSAHAVQVDWLTGGITLNKPPPAASQPSAGRQQ